ncbi:MAG: VaFE repeat-containing surface-anchored protein [Oscillospiraceae bacterium]|nr:VaFE repeat-containing surface-anchored protein [Oscillospiraceae bacterium]
MKKQIRRIVGIVLLFTLCFSALPAYAFALPNEAYYADSTEQIDTIIEDEILEEVQNEPEEEFTNEADLEEPYDEEYENPIVDIEHFDIEFMESSAGFVNHVRGRRVTYEGHRTSLYTANGNTAFCVDPNLPGLDTGTYEISRFIPNNSGYDLLIKGAYYLYGGPGYDSVKHNLFGDPDSLLAYGLSHSTLSYIWSGNEENAFIGLGSATRQHLRNVIIAIDKQDMPTDFNVYVYNEGNSTHQTFLGWEYAPTTPVGELEIRKVSSNPTMSNDSSLYSLEGAVFDVFNSANQSLGRIITDVNGIGQLSNIDVKQTGLYLVEISPPKGFAHNDERIHFEIVSGQTTIVTVSNKPQNDPIGIILRKLDSDTENANPQGGALLAGAEFTLKYYSEYYYNAEQLAGVTPTRTWVVRTDNNGTAFLLPSDLVSGDPLYFASNGSPTVPLGTLTVQESKASEGYLINDELFIRQITPDGFAESVRTYSAPIVPEPIIRGGVAIEKWDNETDKNEPQGSGTLAGAVFEIVNKSADAVVVQGELYDVGDVVYTLITDSNGKTQTSSDLLPYGTYEINEVSPPYQGYLVTGTLSRTFEIREHGKIVMMNTSDTTIKNDPIRGGVEIEKWDVEHNQSGQVQGDATLSGAVFEIWNRSPRSVVVNGVKYAPNTIVHTMTTDSSGLASTTNNLLPFGNYEIIEQSPPTGYLNTGIIRQSFQIRQHGIIVSLKTSDTAIKNNIIRGGVYIEKWDNELGENIAQGSGTLEGAVFEIVNKSADFVFVQDELYAIGEVVYTLTTDSEGKALTSNDLLPYGTYEIREISPPYQGYLSTGVLTRTFEIRENGKIIEMNTADTAIRNDPIRGDLRGVKISDGNAHRMAGVPFRLTSLTTGESHVVITDKNGEFNTASSWNPHSQNTNRGETAYDGIWFGDIDTLDDSVGALLFDTYLIEELRCDANEGRELFTFEVSVYRHDHVINLGTLTNELVPTPEIDTSAIDRDTTTNSAFVNETTTIIDTVYYSGLRGGREYTVVGRLMDKSTGKPLLIDGEQVTSQRTFRAFAEAGATTVEFAFDSRSLAGKQVVVYQYLYYGDDLLAEHTDIDDELQTITFLAPVIGTIAHGKDGNKIIPQDKNAVVIDIVNYDDLLVGRQYILKGILMDKETGKAVLVDGKEVTAETTFIAKESSGSVEVRFTFDSTGLEGKELVVFEYLYYNDELIVEHTDIDDEAQTVIVESNEPETPQPPQPPQPPKSKLPQTGRNNSSSGLLVIGLCMAMIGAVVAIYILKRQRRKSDLNK